MTIISMNLGSEFLYSTSNVLSMLVGREEDDVFSDCQLVEFQVIGLAEVNTLPIHGQVDTGVAGHLH